MRNFGLVSWWGFVCEILCSMDLQVLTMKVYSNIRGYNVNVNAPKLMVTGCEYVECRSGLMPSQSESLYVGPNRPGGLEKAFCISHYVLKHILYVNCYIGVPVSSGWRAGSVTKFIFTQGPEMC